MNLGDLGLVFGALGYVWAGLGGLLVLNFFARKYQKDSAYSGQQIATLEASKRNLQKNSQENLQKNLQSEEVNSYSMSLVYIFFATDWLYLRWSF